ncbi:MAG TPA: hypothetical protein PLL58_01985 [Candidatus Syntrophosphaera sp.]|nr:hypothetical protein [Candidatus Syntrophosphaera sp.]
MTEEIQINVRRIDPDAPGFLPRYRALLASKRALADFAHALPEDVDEAIKLLREHMTSPTKPFEQDAVLNKLTGKELMGLFDVILGANTVPPAKDAA